MGPQIAPLELNIFDMGELKVVAQALAVFNHYYFHPVPILLVF